MQHIDSGSTLRNFKLTISYDGRQFHGWQIQNNAMTVQEAFQTALSKIIGDDFDLKGCSRTDSGVHANMYCISLKTSHPIADVRLKAALNRWLPLSIAVLDCEEADIDFHARYSCTSKEYIYKIWNTEVRNPFLDGYALHYRYKLDEDMLNSAAQAYVGTHDFTSFCGNRHFKKSAVRTIYEIRIEEKKDELDISFTGNGFLQNMVRILTGTLIEVGRGERAPESMPALLKAKERKQAGYTAPPQGLRLEKVTYETMDGRC